MWRCALRRSAIRDAPSASAIVLTPATKTALSPRDELPVSGSRSAMPCASAMSKSTIQAASASSTSSRSEGTAFGSGFGPRTTCSAIGFPTTGPIVSPSRRPHATHRSGSIVVCAARVHGSSRVVDVGELWRGITGSDVRRARGDRDPCRPLGQVLGDELARRVLVPRRRLLRPRRGPVRAPGA